MRERIPFLREAAVTAVPQLSDEQLERIRAELAALPNHFLLVNRISDSTVLIQGVSVTAESPHEADALTWDKIHSLRQRGAVRTVGLGHACHGDRRPRHRRRAGLLRFTRRPSPPMPAARI